LYPDIHGSPVSIFSPLSSLFYRDCSIFFLYPVGRFLPHPCCTVSFQLDICHSLLPLFFLFSSFLRTSLQRTPFYVSWVLIAPWVCCVRLFFSVPRSHAAFLFFRLFLFCSLKCEVRLLGRGVLSGAVSFSYQRSKTTLAPPPEPDHDFSSLFCFRHVFLAYPR